MKEDQFFTILMWGTELLGVLRKGEDERDGGLSQKSEKTSEEDRGVHSGIFFSSPHRFQKRKSRGNRWKGGGEI